jgi:hypothetical protein
LFDPNRHYDELVVDALVARFPVPGANRADIIRATQIMHFRDGRTVPEIAMLLRINEQTTSYYIFKQQVEPLAAIPDWTNQPPFRLCNNGLHEMSPDNVMTKDYPNGKQYEICRHCKSHSDRERYKRKKAE